MNRSAPAATQPPAPTTTQAGRRHRRPQDPAAAAAAPQPPPGRRVALGGLGAATVGGGAGPAGWTWRWGGGEDGDGDGVGGFSAIFLGLYKVDKNPKPLVSVGSESGGTYLKLWAFPLANKQLLCIMFFFFFSENRLFLGLWN